MAENKNYLIDTHVFLWWLNDDRKMSKGLKNILENPANKIFLSVVSVWEILIKKELKKLKIPSDLDEAVENCGFDILPINLSHVLGIDRLSSHHKDPFDRMLVSQASEDQLTLITGDNKLWRYQLPVLRCGVDV